MEKNSTLWVVASEPKPGKEKEYNEWYDQHIDMLFKNQNMKGASRFRRYQQMGENKQACSQYLTLYELPSDQALESLLGSPDMAAAVKDYEAKGKDLTETKWAGRYELWKTLNREKKNEPIIWIVAISCNPTDDEAVNQWYKWKMETLFNFEGLKGASRYQYYKQMADTNIECARFLSVYEFDDKETMDPFEKCPEYASIGESYQKTWINNKDFIIVWSGLYEPLNSLKRD